MGHDGLHSLALDAGYILAVTSTQKIRRRIQLVAAQDLHGGKPCNGVLIETAGCPPPVPENCQMSLWSQWDACSAPCGPGQHQRNRTIAAQATLDGTRCVDPL